MRIFTNYNFVKIRTHSSSGLAFCVELLTKQVSYRISVPMSYISCSRLRKIHEKQHLRIQEGHFLKIALNLDLILSDDGKCPALLKSSRIIDLGAFCVELWSFYCSKRISVPMSYISFWEHCLLLLIVAYEGQCWRL